MKRRYPLALRISLSVLGSMCAVLVAVLAIGGASQGRGLNRMLLEENGQIAAARADQFDELLGGLFAQLQAYSLSSELRSAEPKAVSAYMRRMAGGLPPQAVGSFFAWPDGRMVTSAGDESNVGDRDYFKSIIAGGASRVLANPVVSKTLGYPIVVIASAVRGDSGRTVGVLAYQIPLTKLTEIATGIKVGKAGYGWLVQQDGLVIAHKSDKLVLRLNILGADESDGYKGLSAFGKRMLAEGSGSGEWDNPSGVRYMNYFATPKLAPGWKLGISQPSLEIGEEVNSILFTLVFVFIGGMAIAIAAAAILARSIIKPIKEAGRGFRELAEGEADLSSSIGLDRNDELGDLVMDFNSFLAKLREIMSSLKAAQGELSRIGESLSGSVSGAVDAIDAISADIEAVKECGLAQAASVEESSGAVSQITRNIANLDGLISSQAASITEASAAIEEMVGNIGAVSSSVEKIASEFSSLLSASEAGKATLVQAAERAAQISAQSRSLAEMNAAIAAIASQTNLLAMNAAIEAAHAGEAGKGFSVVADEIRRLSETASEQSKTIGNELGSILGSIDEIVAASNESSSAFELVAERIARTDSLVREVSHAMSEQGEGSKQILEALREMNEVTAQVKTGSAEMSAGNQAVLEEMARLRDASLDVKTRVDAIATGSASIASNVDTVEKMAEGTRGTIERMEGAIGRFVV